MALIGWLRDDTAFHSGLLILGEDIEELSPLRGLLLVYDEIVYPAASFQSGRDEIALLVSPVDLPPE